MSRPTAQQQKQAELDEPRKKIMLSFQQLQMMNEALFNESYVIIKNPSTGSSWQSPNFYYKMFDLWSVEVDGFNLQLELYMKIKSKYPKVAYTTLHEGSETIYMQQLTNPGNKFCIVSYDLHEVIEEPKEDKRNHFQHNSNIFDSFLNNNDISRVDHQQQEKKFQQRHHPQDERVGFHGEISIISQAQEKTLKKSAVKQPTNENHNWDNESSDQKRRFMHSLDDSVTFIQQFLKSFPEDEKLNNTPEPKVPQQKQELSKIKQNPNESQEEYITTSQKWYTQKFNKKNVKYRKKNTSILKSNDLKAPSNNSRAIQITQYDGQFLEKESTVRQMTDMSVEEQIRLKSIDFSLTSEGSISKLYKLSRFDGNASSLWYTAISLPNEGTIMVQCLSEEGQLNGCLGSEEIKKGQCSLYDEEGNIIGNFSFKCKSVCNYVVQTQECLQSNNQSIQVPPSSLEESKIKQQNVIAKNITESEEKPQVNFKAQEKTNEDKKQDSNQPIEVQQQKPIQKDVDLEEQELKPKQIQQQKQGIQSEVKIVMEEQTLKDKQGIKNQNTQELNAIPVFQPKRQNPEMIKAQVQQKVENQQQIRQSLSKPDTRDPVRGLKLEKTDVIQMTIQSKQEKHGEDIQELKKTVRQSRLQKYETNGNEQKKQNNSFTNSPTALPGASMKLETIDSKYASNYPLRFNSFSLETGENLNNIRSSKMEPNFLSSLSNRPPKYNRTNDSYDSRNDYGSYPFDNSRQSPERNLNESIISRNSIINKHKIDFKIENIQLILTKANYNGKILKMQIEKIIYHTETSKGLYILSWEGRGYFFRNVSEYSLLYVEFIEQCQGIQIPTGICKIPLPQLNTHKPNEVFQFQDFVRDENEEQVGRIKIEYKIIDRNQRNSKNKYAYQSSSNSKAFNYIQNGNVYLPRQSSVNPPKKKNIKTHRISTEISSRANESFDREHQRKLSYLENHQDAFSVFSRMKNKSPLSKRKYTGGNTLIPKASRFVEQNMNKKFKKNDPGPGQYEVPSMFDRHATPL